MLRTPVFTEEVGRVVSDQFETHGNWATKLLRKITDVLNFRRREPVFGKKGLLR